jgi:hypothetical protein
VSLQKLKNKYFATRCLQGNVNIWSATHHPDRLFTIEHVDKDEQPTYAMHETMNMSKMDLTSGLVNNELLQNATASQMYTGPIASERDRMIELRFHL